jgi:hypothetical protein
MNFDSAQQLDSICWSFRMADYPRSRDRADINNLFNGGPPFPLDTAQSGNISVNVNFLEPTRLAHDARSQFYQAFLKPGNYFKATTDMGAQHKRLARATVVTKEISKLMKRSLPYTECFRSKFALNVLHGIAPAGFRDADAWCPEPFGVEDVMVPSGTLLTMYNLPFFAIHRSFTGPELIRLTRGPKVDPAWNMALVDACLKWIDQESATLMGSTWPEVWSPEKTEERIKGDGGFYAADNVPTIEAWDFYYWNDDKKVSGWNRRMILDAWSTPASVNAGMVRKTGDIYKDDKQFLYNPGTRKYADKREQIVNWQFADLSAVAPFRYHSVRSLGYLLYAVCHLQNRLRCAFSESVFEQLMIYFRVNSSNDMQTALKIEMVNRGFIDNSVEFIKAADRYQVNANLVQLGLNENANLINRNAATNTQTRQDSPGSEKPTATQWMGEEAKVTQLVSAGLTQAYLYQVPEYREIFRRFCRKNSSDPDVQRFQAACLRQDVPEKMLTPEAWELEPERVMGAGNKTLEMSIAQQLMQFRNLYDPEPQRAILRDFTLAITDDAARADAYVPEQPMKVSDSVHDAQIVAGVLMQGLPVGLKTGMNHIEYVETLMASMAMVVQKISQQKQGVATMDELAGLGNMAQHIGQHIGQIAQDENEKARVKKYGDQLSKMMNLVKAFAQRLQEQMKKQAEGNGQGGPDPEVLAKIEATKITAEAKAANTRESHAARTAQRQVQFEMEQQQKEQQHALDLQLESARSQLDLAVQKEKAEIEIAKEHAKEAAKAKNKNASEE